MSSIIDNALKNVMSIQTNPSAALAGAAQSFRISAELADKVVTSIERKANKQAKIALDLAKQTADIEMKQVDMDFKQSLQQASFAQQSAMQGARFAQQNKLQGASIAAQASRDANKPAKAAKAPYDPKLDYTAQRKLYLDAEARKNKPVYDPKLDPIYLRDVEKYKFLESRKPAKAKELTYAEKESIKNENRFSLYKDKSEYDAKRKPKSTTIAAPTKVDNTQKGSFIDTK